MSGMAAPPEEAIVETAVAIQRIAELELLSKLPQEARNQAAEVFLDVSDLLQYDDGEPLINQGYLSFDTGYVLVDGRVVVEAGQKESITIAAPALLGEMAQFKTFDIRSATVRAQGSAVAAQFYWEDLYRAAEQELPEDAHRAFRNAVERQIWERFEFKEIVNLPLFADLPEELRFRVCLPFPCFAERVRLKEIDTLFAHDAPFKSLGYLLFRGKLKLIRKDVGAKSTSAPDLIGIFPNKGEKGKEWSATAMADGEADILRFSWDHYSNQLVKRLSRDEQVAFMTSIKKNGAKHFWH